MRCPSSNLSFQLWTHTHTHTHTTVTHNCKKFLYKLFCYSSREQSCFCFSWVTWEVQMITGGAQVPGMKARSSICVLSLYYRKLNTFLVLACLSQTLSSSGHVVPHLLKYQYFLRTLAMDSPSLDWGRAPGQPLWIIAPSKGFYQLTMYHVWIISHTFFLYVSFFCLLALNQFTVWALALHYSWYHLRTSPGAGEGFLRGAGVGWEMRLVSVPRCWDAGRSRIGMGFIRSMTISWVILQSPAHLQRSVPHSLLSWYHWTLCWARDCHWLLTSHGEFPP